MTRLEALTAALETNDCLVIPVDRVDLAELVAVAEAVATSEHHGAAYQLVAPLVKEEEDDRA